MKKYEVFDFFAPKIIEKLKTFDEPEYNHTWSYYFNTTENQINYTDDTIKFKTETLNKYHALMKIEFGFNRQQKNAKEEFCKDNQLTMKYMQIRFDDSNFNPIINILANDLPNFPQRTIMYLDEIIHLLQELLIKIMIVEETLDEENNATCVGKRG